MITKDAVTSHVEDGDFVAVECLTLDEGREDVGWDFRGLWM